MALPHERGAPTPSGLEEKLGWMHEEEKSVENRSREREDTMSSDTKIRD
jgi:hypothetical protein